MSLNETCQRGTCGHDIATHHESTFSRFSVDGMPSHYKVRTECLASWCTCPRYIEPTREEP